MNLCSSIILDVDENARLYFEIGRLRRRSDNDIVVRKQGDLYT